MGGRSSDCEAVYETAIMIVNRGDAILTINEHISLYRRGRLTIGSVLRLLRAVRQRRELVPAKMLDDPRAERVTDNVHGRSKSI